MPIERLAHALTPLVPVFFSHVAAVAPLIAAICDTNTARVAAGMDILKPAALGVWAGIVLLFALGEAGTRPRSGLRLVRFLALCACALVAPPLVTFALYFCLHHSLCHLDDFLHSRAMPGRISPGKLALLLAPMTIAGLFALQSLWEGWGGTIPTPRLLADGLHLLAALTIPHMLLEYLAQGHGALHRAIVRAVNQRPRPTARLSCAP